MIFSWKIQNFQKIQKFSHSIGKVPKMFYHLEIHWGALGRRNIDREAPAAPSDYFLFESVEIQDQPQNPAPILFH